MAIEKTINLNVNTKGAQKEVNNLEKAVEGVNEEVKETSASTEQMGGALDSATGGAITKFKGLKSGLKGVITSFKSLRVAIIATGIGALLIAITAVGQAFTRSEEGQNKFAKILAVIGSVVDNLLDGFAILGEGIISAFENPKKAWNSFTDTLNQGYQFIKNQIIDRFQGGWAVLSGRVQSGILKMRIAWNEFTGDAEEAETLKTELEEVNQKVVEGVEQIANANKALVKVYDSAKDKIKEFTDEIKKDADNAGKIADARAKAEKMARNLIVERAEAERKIAAIREKAADKENFTAAERIELLKEAGAISEDLANKETEVARLRLDAKVLENSLAKSNKQALDEEAQLKADLINKETQRLKLQKALTAEVTTSTREANAEAKAATAKEKARIKELDDFKKKLRDAEAVTEQEKRDLELIKIQEHYDNLILQAKENNIITDELEAARDEAKRLKQKEFDDKDLATKKANTEAEIELEKKRIKAKQQALDAVISIAGAETGVGKALLIAKQALALKETLMDIKKITFKGTQAVASAGVNAAQNVSESSKIGFPQNIITIAAAIGQGLSIISSVKKAVGKTKAAGSVGSSVSTPSVSGSGSQSLPPSFNIVGASDTNQLADAIGGQTQQPVQAFVVANDVTTAQSLENNIVEGATL